MLETFDSRRRTTQAQRGLAENPVEAKLKLVVSNKHPLKGVTLPQVEQNSRSRKSFFATEVRFKGPCLYRMAIQDPSHYVAVNLILEIKEALDEFDQGSVICYFPKISDEILQELTRQDNNLYSIIMIQFQMKILERLLLFCATHNATTLVIFANDQNDDLGIYQDFLAYQDHLFVPNSEMTELVIAADQGAYRSWMDFMHRVTVELRQMLWNEQYSSSTIKKYLKSRPL
ncbi:MAG: hypothetical protein WCG04_01910 [Alphaproteobacteria bacterium]